MGLQGVKSLLALANQACRGAALPHYWQQVISCLQQVFLRVPAGREQVEATPQPCKQSMGGRALHPRGNAHLAPRPLSAPGWGWCSKGASLQEPIQVREHGHGSREL